VKLQTFALFSIRMTVFNLTTTKLSFFVHVTKKVRSLMGANSPP